MLIAADIGNTNIVIGFFKDGNFLFSRRLHTGPPQSVDEYEMLLRGMLFAFNVCLLYTSPSPRDS